MSISTTPLPGATADPLYPDSDGKPMAETGIHVVTIFELFQALRRQYRDREDVYLAADMFLYYEEGNPKARKAPDVMVCMGVRGNHQRRSFRVWEEHTVPTVVFEITSKKTRREDAESKPAVYARIGIPEYFLFDPTDEYLRPRLQGFRLTSSGYEPLSADNRGRLVSHELGFILHPQDYLLRLIDAQTEVMLPTTGEVEQRASGATRALHQLRRARRAKRKAIEHAETESRRAEAESRRAEALEEELKRLRERLGET